MTENNQRALVIWHKHNRKKSQSGRGIELISSKYLGTYVSASYRLYIGKRILVLDYEMMFEKPNRDKWNFCKGNCDELNIIAS